MIDSYTTNKGQKYSLLGCVLDGKDKQMIQKYDGDYYEKALAMANEKKTHIFYNIKKYRNRGGLGYEFSQYFLVPIDAADVEKIPLTFNLGSSDYYFGIAYYHDTPDISYDEKMRIRESYWNGTSMSGYDYEEECADELRRMGFYNVEVTKSSGDQGIDVLAWKDGKKYGIQCKYYQSPVSNKAVQEASAGAQYYDCDIAVVMTNSTFTKSAEELAHKIGVKLWSCHSNYREV